MHFVSKFHVYSLVVKLAMTKIKSVLSLSKSVCTVCLWRSLLNEKTKACLSFHYSFILYSLQINLYDNICNIQRYPYAETYQLKNKTNNLPVVVLPMFRKQPTPLLRYEGSSAKGMPFKFDRRGKKKRTNSAYKFEEMFNYHENISYSY